MNDRRFPPPLRRPSNRLDPRVRELLDAAARDVPPPDRISAAVGAALAATTLGAAPPPGGAAARPAAPATSGPGGAAAAMKIALLALAGAGLVGYAALGFDPAAARRGAEPASAAGPVEPGPAPTPAIPAVAEGSDPPSAHDLGAAEAQPHALDRALRPDTRNAGPPRTTAKPSAKAEPPEAPPRWVPDAGAPGALPQAPESSIEAQLAYLREARARRQRGDAAGALELLDRYPAEFPAGVLGPEASAMAVDAALAAGRPGEARARADKFLAEHGASPQAPRIRQLRERLETP